MADIKVVKEWLTEADKDFDFASFALKESDEFFSHICFHFQQAAEKYLKAYIVAYDLPFKKIHNLPQLLKICQQKDESFRNLAKEAEFLTDFYIDTRYPAFWPVGRTKKEAKKAQQATLTIRNFVKKKIESKI